MDGLFGQMVASYTPKTHKEERSAIYKVMQKLTLAGLWCGVVWSSSWLPFLEELSYGISSSTHTNSTSGVTASSCNWLT